MAEAKKKRGKQAKSVKPSDSIPYGMKIVDTHKKEWIFGKEIGSGGCGVVYEGSNGSTSAFDFVIKVEYHQNGPLFTEMHVYHCVGKQDSIAQFAKKNRLGFLGIPVWHGSGSFNYNDNKYRFMVLQKYGKDLQHVLDENGKKLHPKTVFTVGSIVINSLEYIHSHGYVHGDIKAGNLLLGPSKDTINNVYLLDMGIATRYITRDDGVHKSDKPDPKKSNNGTPEFISRDAHIGVFSRRSDLETLGYNMLLWLSGSLPWLKFVGNLDKLKAEKNRYMNDVPLLMKGLFPHSSYPELEEYLTYVNKLGFTEAPGYDYCVNLFKRSVKRLGLKDDGILTFKGLKDTIVDKSSDLSSSQKENNGKKKAEKKRRVDMDASTSRVLSSGEVLTPAMLAVLNRQQEKAAEKATKKPRKKAE